MNASRKKVLEKFDQLFGSHRDAEELLKLLYLYGSREGDRERERVQLAILKLSEGDPGKLRSNVDAALVDYRDVLAWAEYPEQMASGKSAYNTTPWDIEEVRKRDREQYLNWLEEDHDES